MHSNFPIAKTRVQTWRPYTLGSTKEAEEELPDVGYRVEQFNASEHYILLIDPVNSKVVIPPRPQLMAKYNDDDKKGGIKTGYFLTRKVAILREPVSLYTDDISNVDPEMSKQDNIGSISSFKAFRKRYGKSIERSGVQKFERVGEGRPRRFMENDYLDSMSEAFMLDLEDIEFDRPMYLAASNSVIVKLTGEPTRDEMLLYNHPLALGRVRRRLANPLGAEVDIRYVWRPPFDEAQRVLWINVLGKAVQIRPTAGAVGAPGLTVCLAGEKPFIITPEQLNKDMTAYGVFPTAEAAESWQSPVTRDAAKHKFETEQLDRKTDSAVLTELQNQIKFFREDAEKRAKENAEELKRQREDFAAEVKARDEEAKRQRENEQAERQRKVDIWKAAGTIAGIVLTFGLALVKFVEKIAGK